MKRPRLSQVHLLGCEFSSSLRSELGLPLSAVAAPAFSRTPAIFFVEAHNMSSQDTGKEEPADSGQPEPAVPADPGEADGGGDSDSTPLGYLTSSVDRTDDPDGLVTKEMPSQRDDERQE